jgi:hypothetical protein
MNHNLAQPCRNCPFRNDIRPYLRPDRIREIVESLFAGQSFPCHLTTVDDEEGYDLVEAEHSEQCAGAEIFLAHHGTCTQMRRIAERLDVPVSELDLDAPICRTLDEMLEVHGHGGPMKKGTQGDYCCVCDQDCEAPAGWQIGTGVARGDTYANYKCGVCGQPVCGKCSSVSGLPRRRIRTCNNCADEQEQESIRMCEGGKQILCCPRKALKVYKAYMTKRGIDFQERRLGAEKVLVLSRKYRPHAWKLKF